eukprot:764738-Hanusia_phi.AAC.3
MSNAGETQSDHAACRSLTLARGAAPPFGGSGPRRTVSEINGRRQSDPAGAGSSARARLAEDLNLPDRRPAARLHRTRWTWVEEKRRKQERRDELRRAGLIREEILVSQRSHPKE